MKYFLIILLFASSKLWAQDVLVIYKADTIYFYGYDFSHAIVKTKHPINDYVFPWIVYISEENPPSYFEEKMYMNVIHDFSYTNRVNAEFIENLVGGAGDGVIKVIKQEGKSVRHPLLFDNANNTSSKKERSKDVSLMTISNKNIKKYLSEYSLEQKKGIGLVVFIAEINKEKESTLLHFVFFDVKSRDLISIKDSYLKGASGIGMEKHWQENFSQSVTKFLISYNSDLYFDYRKEYKRKKKRMKRLQK